MDVALAALDPIKDVDADVHGKMVTVFKKCESTPADSDPCVYAINIATCIIETGKGVRYYEKL